MQNKKCWFFFFINSVIILSSFALFSLSFEGCMQFTTKLQQSWRTIFKGIFKIIYTCIKSDYF